MKKNFRHYITTEKKTDSLNQARKEHKSRKSTERMETIAALTDTYKGVEIVEESFVCEHAE